MKNWKLGLVATLLALGSAGMPCAWAQETKAAPPAIDWNKAREIYQRSQKGETLTAEEQAYLDRAKALRAQQNGNNRPGNNSQLPVLPARESTDLVPLPDLVGDAQYKGQSGGLYGHGSNEIPAAHRKLADAAVAAIKPLDENGAPAADGKIALVSIGMSNTTMEFSKFKQVAEADPTKNPKLLIVDCAQGGQDAAAWVEDGTSKAVWGEAERRLKAAGATDAQVQVIWIKQALKQPGRLGEYPKHADVLQEDMVKIVQLAKERWPNLKVAYLSSRIFGGYAVTALNPEPYAYEGAFAVRGAIELQMKGDERLSVTDNKAPVLLWGPYLWTDGAKGRKGDSVVWKHEDVGRDGTHPSESGRQKVAEMLLNFFKTDVTAKGWFTSTK